jgi:hypothetical protein
MKEKCWLIGEGSRRWLPSFEAASRGLPVQGWRYGPLADIPARPGAIIAVDFDNFQGLATSARVSLREKIIAVATFYIAGSLAGRQHSLTLLGSVAL